MKVPILLTLLVLAMASSAVCVGQDSSTKKHRSSKSKPSTATPKSKKPTKPKTTKISGDYLKQDGPHGFYTRKPKSATKEKESTPEAKVGLIIKLSKSPKVKPGDRLLSIKDANGQSFPIRSRQDFEDFLVSHPKGGRATVRVERNGSYHTLVIKNFSKEFKF